MLYDGVCLVFIYLLTCWIVDKHSFKELFNNESIIGVSGWRGRGEKNNSSPGILSDPDSNSWPRGSRIQTQLFRRRFEHAAVEGWVRGVGSVNIGRKDFKNV